MNSKERPIQQHRFYYDSDSEYDTDPREDEEYNSRPDIKDVKQQNKVTTTKKITRKNIRRSIIDMFESDED